MKKILELRILFTVLVAVVPLVAGAQTTFFSDTFSSGSTLNTGPYNLNSTTAAGYVSMMGLTGGNTTNSINPGDLNITIPNSSSVVGEVAAMFTNSVIPLTAPGDYIALTVTFINTSNVMSSTTVGNASASDSLLIGLYDTGGVAPNDGPITTGSGNLSGGTQGWLGYVGRLFYNSSPSIITRPAQAGSTTSQNQELLSSGASSTQSYNNPKGTGLTNGSSPAVIAITNLVRGNVYTLQFSIAFATQTSLTVTNSLYLGAGTSGNLIYSTATNFPNGSIATNGCFITAGFNGFAVGAFNKSSAGQPVIMDITSIQVVGHSTAVTQPPTITSQPISVALPSGASCAFSLTSIGFGQQYQWHRHGTNLLDGGNISGSTQNTLVISPAGPNDAESGANSYYCTVTGAGGFHVDSSTATLTNLATATNLTWSGSSANWDLNTSSAWVDQNSAASTFNYGDNVVFNDLAGGALVTLTGNYLAAGSVTVSNATGTPFVFNPTSSGRYAGPGALYYNGPIQLTIGNVNTYSGGTIISNTPVGLGLYLENLAGLGSGPVSVALAGSKLEIVPAGGGSSALNNDLLITNDFTITFDGLGTYAGNLSGNITVSPGKTLTFNGLTGNTITNQRIRLNKDFLTIDGNLVLNSPMLSLAPYSGTNQTFNGVISGSGNLWQRGGGMAILTGANTYTGGTIPSAGTIAFGIDTAGSPIGTGPLLLTTEAGSTSGNGALLAYGAARTITNAVQYPSGSNHLELIITGTNALTFSGPVDLHGQDGINTFTTRLLTVSNTALTTISGVMSDGGAGYGFSKDGPATLALTATETYTGPTAVSNGTLWVNGQLNASSTVTVATNGNLGGTGTINGPVTVLGKGSIEGGASTIGTLNINNSLTLAGGTVVARVNRSGSAADELNVSGAINVSSPSWLVVTNTGAALHNGDTFQVFNKAFAGGANVYVGGAGVTWNNNLAANGTISVASVGLPAISTTFSSPTLTLSWPAAYAGWEVQSNRVALDSSTNWFTVPGTASSTSYAVTVNNARTNVFYRLIFP